MAGFFISPQKQSRHRHNNTLNHMQTIPITQIQIPEHRKTRGNIEQLSECILPVKQQLNYGTTLLVIRFKVS